MAPENDAGIQAAREAVDFWHRAFSSGQVRNRRFNTMPRSRLQGGVASTHKRCVAPPL